MIIFEPNYILLLNIILVLYIVRTMEYILSAYYLVTRGKVPEPTFGTYIVAAIISLIIVVAVLVL